MSMTTLRPDRLVVESFLDKLNGCQKPHERFALQVVEYGDSRSIALGTKGYDHSSYVALRVLGEGNDPGEPWSIRIDVNDPDEYPDSHLEVFLFDQEGAETYTPYPIWDWDAVVGTIDYWCLHHGCPVLQHHSPGRVIAL